MLNFKNLGILILLLLFPLIAISTTQISQPSNYAMFRLAIYISITLLSFASLFQGRFFLVSKFAMFYIMALFLLIVSGVFIAILLNMIMIDIIIQFAIPLIIVLSCSQFRIDSNFTLLLLNTYILSSIFAAAHFVLFVNGGFVIQELYVLAQKNQVGPFISLGAVVSVFLFIKMKHSESLKQRRYRYVYLISFLLLFVSVSIMRNRASVVSMLSLLMLMSVMSYRRTFKMKDVFKSFIILISGIVVLFFVQDQIMSLLQKVVVGRYQVNDLDSLSAGRTDVYIQAFIEFLNNPIIGNKALGTNIGGTPHNYLLYVLFNFGILFGLPLVLHYGYLWVYFFKRLKTVRNFSFSSLSVLLLLFSLITCQFEYTHPYGPGTSQVIIWIVIGLTLNNNDLSTNSSYFK